MLPLEVLTVGGGSAAAGRGWSLGATADAALSSVRVLLRDDAVDESEAEEEEGEEATGRLASNMRVLRKRPHLALRVAASVGEVGAAAQPQEGLASLLLAPRSAVPQWQGMRVRAQPLGWGSSGPVAQVGEAEAAAARAARKAAKKKARGETN